MKKQIFERFLNDLVLEGKANATVEEYWRRIKSFLIYLENHGKIDISEATRQHVLDYRREMLEHGLSARTVNAKTSTLCVFFKWAQVEGIIDKNPVPERLYITPKPQKIHRLSDEELNTFLMWVNNLQENVRAAFYLMAATGARVGEVANLQANDVSIKNGKVYINITGAKWVSDRFIPIISKEAAEIVWKYRNQVSINNLPLFRISKRTLQTYATAFSNDSGITFYCHLLRHTFASRLLEKGVPITTIQYLLGHKSMGMTAHYTKSAAIGIDLLDQYQIN